MTVRRRATLLGTVALAASLGGCSLWGPEGGPGGAGIAGPAGTPTPTPVDATLGADGVQRIEVTAGDDLRFTPSWVRAKPGVIEFVFRNTGVTPHHAEVDVPGASGSPGTGNLNGGQSQTVRVTVQQPGQYPFPCLYHVSSGMQGTLEIR